MFLKSAPRARVRSRYGGKKHYGAIANLKMIIMTAFVRDWLSRTKERLFILLFRSDRP